jgi:hypothetical protein
MAETLAAGPTHPDTSELDRHAGSWRDVRDVLIGLPQPTHRQDITLRQPPRRIRASVLALSLLAGFGVAVATPAEATATPAALAA